MTSPRLAEVTLHAGRARTLQEVLSLRARPPPSQARYTLSVIVVAAARAAVYDFAARAQLRGTDAPVDITRSCSCAAPHARRRACRAQADVAGPVVLSNEVLSRLPPIGAGSWPTRSSDVSRAAAFSHGIRGSAATDACSLAGADPRRRQLPEDAADEDTSPRVRTTIAQTIAADARWMALPDSAALLEGVVASDPDPAVSLATLETLRRWRMRHLNTLLNERVVMARKNRHRVGRTTPRCTRAARKPGTWHDAAGVSPFSSAALHRGTVDQPVRVVAFGDFGTGSDAQKALAQTLAAYHKDRPFSLGITLGDNFYSVGMESPADPRWETQWEQLTAHSASRSTALWETTTGDIPTARQPRSCTSETTTWKMPSSYYTFSAGPVQFFALDTQSVALSVRQLEWLDTELSRSQARWKVVYGHHPIFSGGAYEDRPDLIEKLLPILRNRADVYSAATTITFRRCDRRAICISTSLEGAERAFTNSGHTSVRSSRPR